MNTLEPTEITGLQYEITKTYIATCASATRLQSAISRNRIPECRGYEEKFRRNFVYLFHLISVAPSIDPDVKALYKYWESLSTYGRRMKYFKYTLFIFEEVKKEIIDRGIVKLG